MIFFKNYIKSYGDHLILKMDELILPKGYIWIKGMNGSGKSTLLKSIAGIIPFKGDILIDEVSLKNNPVEFRRKITYAEAEPFFPEILTGREIIEFVASVRDCEKADVQEFTRYFGVEKYYRQATGGYSTGMLKKVALVIAFLGSPDLILLDEPFAFIDNETESKLIDLLKTGKSRGKNVIITSHHELFFGKIGFDAIYSLKNTNLIHS